MKKLEQLRESAKYFKLLSKELAESLKAIKESTVVDFQDIETYEKYRLFVKEGLVAKDYRHYKLTQKGQVIVEAFEQYQADPKKFKELVKEHKEGTFVQINYKKHLFESNEIKTAIAKFGLEKDGLPIVKVDEESYSNLIHRTKGQHWKQYLGEEGRQLIRQKKLEKFYVESELTGRRYLYIVP